MAKIRQHFALFSWWKSCSALPQMHYSMPNAILTKIFNVRMRQWGCPIFTAKIQKSFAFNALWRTSEVSSFCVWHLSACSHCDEPKPSKVLEHVETCRMHRETNVTWWHGSRQSHYDDRAHCIAWICTYDNCLEHIPILQGQELSWLERVTHVATRVHHTKCTITHTQTTRHIYIYTHIHASCTMLSHRVEK